MGADGVVIDHTKAGAAELVRDRAPPSSILLLLLLLLLLLRRRRQKTTGTQDERTRRAVSFTTSRGSKAGTELTVDGLNVCLYAWMHTYVCISGISTRVTGPIPRT